MISARGWRGCCGPGWGRGSRSGAGRSSAGRRRRERRGSRGRCWSSPRGGRRAGRRVRLLTALMVGAVIVGVILALPLFRKAVNDIGGLPIAYSDVIREQAADKHLDPALVAAVIYAETKFDPRQSSAGAEGLMQIL